MSIALLRKPKETCVFVWFSRRAEGGGFGVAACMFEAGRKNIKWNGSESWGRGLQTRTHG